MDPSVPELPPPNFVSAEKQIPFGKLRAGSHRAIARFGMTRVVFGVGGSARFGMTAFGAKWFARG